MERLDDFIEQVIVSKPENRCFWWEGVWYDGAFLKDLMDKTVRALVASGFSKGDRLAVLMPNCPMILGLSLAVWRLGGVFCPLNAKPGASSLISTLSLLSPFAVAISEETHGEITAALDENGYSHVICPHIEPPEPFKGKSVKIPESDENLAVIFSTSGTTGASKAVPLTHGNIISDCRGCMGRLEALRPGDVFLNVLPNFHAFGFTAGTMLPFFAASAQTIVANFMPPQNTVAAISESQANVIILVPTMLNFMLSLLERDGKKLSGVKIVVTGGDRYDPRFDDKVKTYMGVGVLEGYGITECSPVLSVNESYDKRRLGTVGRMLDGFVFQLRDEDGTVLTENAKGEGVLWVSGSPVAKEYFRRAESDNSRFDNGWFNTGDYVKVEDGFIMVIDRVSDIIIVGGFNVYPKEVEAILLTHPAVSAAVVVGIKSHIVGEIPKAFIIKKADASVTEQDIIRFCKDNLSHYKAPRKVEFVDAFPLSPAGKVLRRKLRERE
ncbi:AMP-dependent synthetase [Synergistales bacterium]|nr:AMP-dependent synthetase [Synergistales bacterium]